MKELTEQNFNEFIGQNKLTLVDFWGVWCAPCRMILPTLEEISNEVSTDVLEIGKLNVDDHRSVATKYGIRSIPALFFFKDGEIVDKIVGAQPKSVFQSKIEQLTK